MYIDYYKYIESKEWKDKREELFKLVDKVCFKCGATNNLQVHHKYYGNLGNEIINDLIVLCRDCHDKVTLIHKWSGCSEIEATKIFVTKSYQNKERNQKLKSLKRCKKCNGELFLKDVNNRKTKNKPYYYTKYWYCNGCKRIFLDNKYKIINKNF